MAGNAADRGKRAKALILSPFATFPDDAGQRRRARQTTAMFRDLGYDITFLLYAFEDDWYWRYQPRHAAAMRAEWGDVRIFHASREVALPPRDGMRHGVDEWWDPLLGDYITRMLQFEAFDIVVVHNVWLSNALTLFPKRTTKILDMHDLFYPRLELFEKFGVGAEFLMIDKDEEYKGLGRADILLTIKQEEADRLRADGIGAQVINVPYVESERVADPSIGVEYRHAGKVVFGFLGSGHGFNVKGMRDLLAELDRQVRRTFAPVEVLVAGNVCRALAGSPHSFQPRLIGYADDVMAIYRESDIAIVPVFNGTGFKVKVAELAAMKVPFLCAEHAAEGGELDASVVFATPADMAEAMVRISFHRPPLAAFTESSSAAARRMAGRFDASRTELARALAQAGRPVVVDVSFARFDGRSLIKLIATVIEARTLSYCHEYVIRVPRSYGLPINKLNATSGMGISFGEFDGEQPEPSPIARRVVLDGLSAVSSDIVFRQPDHAKLICDLRFFDADVACFCPPQQIDRFAAYLVSHRQVDAPKLLPADTHRDFFCLPFTGHELRWDPSIKRMIGAWKRSAVFTTAFSSGRSSLLCSNAADADFLSRVLQALDIQDTQVINCGDTAYLNELISIVLSIAVGNEGSFVVIDALRPGSWLAALLDEVAANCAAITTMPLSEFMAQRCGSEAPASLPRCGPATSNIYWEMDSRISR